MTKTVLKTKGLPCGEGEVDGQKRGHFDMVGKIQVRSIISETQ